MNKQIYIASPLFNEEQMKRIDYIETMCSDFGIPSFSPRRDAVPFVNTPEGWKNTFKSDLEGLDSSGLILANLDWHIPDGRITAECEVKKTVYENGKSYDVYEPIQNVDLNIPDPGTVWEIARGYSQNIPVIGYSIKPTPLMNIMITESIIGLVPNDYFIGIVISQWANVENEEDAERFFEMVSDLKWSGEAQ